MPSGAVPIAEDTSRYHAYFSAIRACRSKDIARRITVSGKDDLEQQFVSLKDVFSNLGTQLTEVSKHLEESGTPPSTDLIEALGSARLEFEAFRGKVLTAAEFLELPSLPELADISSLQALESLLHTVVHAGEAMEEAEKTRQRALTVLDRALTLAHCEHDHYDALLDVQNEAHDLQAAISTCQWTDLHPETQVLADGQHPLTALLTLVESREGLDDEQWIALQDRIAQSFGNPIAVPAARGKFFLAQTAATDSLSTAEETNDAKSARLTRDIGHASSPSIDHGQTVAREDDGRLAPMPGDNSHVSDMTSQEEAENVQEADGGDGQHIAGDKAQYDRQNIAPADLDRFLREQIRAVRKETQEQTFIRGIRQRLR
jgi:hypothetical protein